ncbi:hypothetical protein IQ06DRAFT_139749 [Phaeosphaeriaceae sp. SRC1lsM3a]|nr:hypothetical protein IQ06DRAFT_139749 [Stagonospora sp. SRC1lsM3a]
MIGLGYLSSLNATMPKMLDATSNKGAEIYISMPMQIPHDTTSNSHHCSRRVHRSRTRTPHRCRRRRRRRSSNITRQAHCPRASHRTLRSAILHNRTSAARLARRAGRRTRARQYRNARRAGPTDPVAHGSLCDFGEHVDACGRGGCAAGHGGRVVVAGGVVEAGRDGGGGDAAGHWGAGG